MFSLDGFWLLGALAVVYVLGGVTWPKVKDKVLGVPSDLRTALQAAETNAMNALKAEKANVIAKVIGTVGQPAPAPVAKPAEPTVIVDPPKPA